ncbi:hypothetical protein HJG60_010846 [Phyllostomus discolor]|uniref:Uncharacterized protein n=1 Tax=Phyllostomus discolor TaxID=89673 RepID=A0A834EA74_9CHIR|nr:hypothetical protein HJG60_010846 [Phyllostomus discolor]
MVEELFSTLSQSKIKTVRFSDFYVLDLTWRGFWARAVETFNKTGILLPGNWMCGYSYERGLSWGCSGGCVLFHGSHPVGTHPLILSDPTKNTVVAAPLSQKCQDAFLSWSQSPHPPRGRR